MTKKPSPEAPTMQAVSYLPAEFSDPESQRVLSATAIALARELGRQTAREHFAELLAKSTKSSPSKRDQR